MRLDRRDLSIVAILLLTAATAIGDGLLPGRTPIPLDILGQFEPWAGEMRQPKNPLLGDPVMQISHRAFVTQAWSDGHLPLWNSGVMGGHPHAGDTLSQPFYPPHIGLGLVLDPYRVFGIQILLQLWIAGILMYAWMRTLSLGRIPALAGALVWTLSGFQQVWMAYPFWMGSLAWLPGAAAAWEVARRSDVHRRRSLAVALGALAAGLVVLGGQLQFAVFGALFLSVYAAGRALSSTRAELGRDLLLGVGIGSLGVLVSAIHWLPTLEQARDTVRPTFGLEALLATGVPLSQLATALAPWALGDPRHANYVGAQNANEMAVYIGLIPLLLVFATPFARRDRLCAIASGITLAVALIATGTIAAAPLTLIPLVERFGLMRWLSMWPLAAAFIVALGLDAPRGDPFAAGRLRNAVIVATAVLALLAAIAILIGDPRPTFRPTDGLVLGVSAAALVFWTFRPSSSTRLALVILILGADLLLRYTGYTPSAPLEQAFPLPNALSRIVEEHRDEPFRIAAFQRDRIVLGPSVAPSIGLDEIGGYTSSGRLSYRDFVEHFSDPPGIDAIASNANMVSFSDANPLLLRMLNVHYVLADGPLPDVAREIVRRPVCERIQTLDAGESIGRDIKVHAGGLNRVDVRVVGTSTVAAHLVPSAGSDDHLAYAELTSEGGDSGSADVVRPMYFEPIPDSAGRTFHVFVDRPEGSSGESPALCVDELGLVVDAWTTEPRYPLVFEADGVFVHHVPEPYGRAWIVPAARFVDDQAAALQAIGGADFDPLAEVIIEGLEQVEGTEQIEEIVQAGSSDAVQSGGVTVSDAGPNMRRVSFAYADAGWLILSEAYAPGWRARIDGRSVPVYRANGGLQAIAFPAGAREAVLRYRPMSVLVGAFLTMIGLVAIGLIASVPISRAPEHAPQPPSASQA